MLESQPRVEQGLHYRWHVARRTRTGELLTLGVDDPLLAQLLFNRGLREAEATARFVSARAQALVDPTLLAGIDEAVPRIAHAITSQERIAVYGDYDVDGLSATAVLFTTLERLGARVQTFIPHRERDGYGLSTATLAALRGDGIGLIVTVDCGVTAHQEIATARSAGLDVIVTDHHLPPAMLPPTTVINPRRSDCQYPFKDLAGVGVAFKLACALAGHLLPAAESDRLADELLDLAALGTLADAVPLLDENRTIVARGLDRLNALHRPGIRALVESAGLPSGAIDAQRAAYSLIPRLNAAGRLDHGQLALDLLLTRDFDEARRLAARLGQLNLSRQQQVRTAMAELRCSLGEQPSQAVLVVRTSYPLGILGLLSSRLASTFDRPVVVLRENGSTCAGSARSVPGVNIVEALEACAPLLDRFGGHAMAAGLTLRTDRVDELRRSLAQAVLERRNGEPLEPALAVDAELRPDTAARWQTLELLDQLEPCGQSNPQPLFLTKGLQLLDCRPVTGCHVRLRLKAPGARLEGIVFDRDPSDFSRGRNVDLVYHLRRSRYGSMVAPEVEIRDWREAG